MTPSSYYLCLYKPASTAQRYRGWLVLLSPFIYPRSCYFQKQMEWKIIQLCFWKAGRVNYMFFLPDKFIILAALTFMSCQQSNTVFSCNIVIESIFPVSVTLFDCRSRLYIFLRISNDIPGLRLKLSFEERLNTFLYLVLYLTAECLISANFWPLNGLSLESLSLISPFYLRILLHPVNLYIYIVYLVFYSWGIVDFNPLLLFFIFSIYFLTFN